MLKPGFGTLLAGTLCLATLLLVACSEPPTPPSWKPQRTESAYRLLFNEAFVGQVLFRLAIDADGAYRIEAFTSPAGQMSKAGNQHVLEVSTGRIEGTRIRPMRFDHSVIRGDEVDAVNLLFDWPGNTLHLLNGDERREVRLLPDTQDRLSYLLAARMLARQGEGSRQLQVADGEATEETLLTVIGRSTLELPLGEFAAIGVRRIGADPTEERELWFDERISPLPLRVVRQQAGNTLDLQIESIVDLFQPASE